MDLLANTVRRYDWGSTTAIPALLGLDPTGEPQAELWLGAHASAPSRIDRGEGERSLAEVIAADPLTELGPATLSRFGPELPFLLKVLAAERPLSVQVHPTLAQARAGFADEETRGVPIEARARNYKDPHHKPELICALSEFDAFCGFRAPAATAELLESLDAPCLEPWIDALRHEPDGLRSVVADVLSGSTGGGTQLASAIAEVARSLEEAAASSGPHVKACASYALAAHEFPGDPGIIVLLLLNHVRLEPGQALYLGAGVPHAYVRGLGVEIMANSDNVLRCGLTSKHVDIPELLRVVDFRPTEPRLLNPVPGAGGEQLYPAPVDEFRLSHYTLRPGGPGTILIPGGVPQILLCTAGEAVLTGASGAPLTLARGQSAFLPATWGDTLITGGEATLFRATVPAAARQ